MKQCSYLGDDDSDDVPSRSPTKRMSKPSSMEAMGVSGQSDDGRVGSDKHYRGGGRV